MALGITISTLYSGAGSSENKSQLLFFVPLFDKSIRACITLKAPEAIMSNTLAGQRTIISYPGQALRAEQNFRSFENTSFFLFS
jgi:hypothetical protein